MSDYYSPVGGLPDRNQLLTGRAVFTDAYAVIPRGVLTDIVTSRLPGWDKTRAWILARPLSGFAETFSESIIEIEPGGGSQNPEPDREAEAVLFVLSGLATLDLEGEKQTLMEGSYAFLGPNANWSLQVSNDSAVSFKAVWIRKRYEPIDGISPPGSFVTKDGEVSPSTMPGYDGAWSTTRFVDPDDLAHDMHVNIVNFEPGASIPFAETHVMEHGLYMLHGKGVYRLNGDWVEVEAGDFLWLRSFCPQACYAGGPEPFRYLLYKNVNRHMPLGLGR
ncbi:bifunctional allantoicase/(S)-ureidoglycine aminohydrolase [Notoacmeibacter sp. MSK16QG-6]|uniref:bifunctional allantoicase/(S)-ureidoglycine aminohydrolase n=1 Tax=Notoacmeibacter sp. MSK16QG-6 TaxID=2957982 RepID=UPI00209D5D4C|nr:bifunctional allantoicase/(S)-ureidoglycine aminohydrolase [Notoacmeibacter sp. MSK16QG-6]MCP1199765.1 bifunctional allantoicase/(S)-ureidoglycine aminohydrolase [Notoacmeibacter sp. MSK16QG-6]